MEELKKYPYNSIREVSLKTGIKLEELRDAQLNMLRSCVKRNSKNWDIQGYGK